MFNSGAPEFLATMLAHQATAKVLEQDLNKYEDSSIISSSSEDTCENIAGMFILQSLCVFS